MTSHSSAAGKIFVFILAALSSAIAAFGQKPAHAMPDAPIPAPNASATATPTVDQIIERYQQAVGGRAAWQKLNSRSSMGTIEVTSMNLSGTVVMHEKAPDKMLTIIILAGSAFREAFDGKAAGRKIPQDGLREETGAGACGSQAPSRFLRSLRSA